jgi:hypothetical protein
MAAQAAGVRAAKRQAATNVRCFLLCRRAHITVSWRGAGVRAAQRYAPRCNMRAAAVAALLRKQLLAARRARLLPPSGGAASETLQYHSALLRGIAAATRHQTGPLERYRRYRDLARRQRTDRVNGAGCGRCAHGGSSAPCFSRIARARVFFHAARAVRQATLA